MEAQRPILRWLLGGLVLFVVALYVVGSIFRTPLKTVNIVNETSETITISTTVDKKVRVFSAQPGQRAHVKLVDQDASCSEQEMSITTPTKRRAKLEGTFCQDENHVVTEDVLLARD